MRFEVAAPGPESSWPRTMLQLKPTARSPLRPIEPKSSAMSSSPATARSFEVAPLSMRQPLDARSCGIMPLFASHRTSSP
jgi:hypothetical protein